MIVRNRHLLAASMLTLATAAHAQERGPGWEFGLGVIYQDSQALQFDGGSSVETDSDYGLSVLLGYRFNAHLDVQLAFDWQDTDYKARLVPQAAPNANVNVNSSMEAFTPRVVVNYNVLNGPITPYITGAVGWTFIDTNIPSGLPQDYCWFDPWWGPVCVREQPTAGVDELVYDLGVGVRFDLNAGYSFQLAYERHWADFENATSTPEFDQLKFGFVVRY